MRQSKNEKDVLAAKMQLYQKWKADYQKHQEACKKEQAYLKAKKQDIEQLWGEISALQLRMLSSTLHCEPEQLMDKLQDVLAALPESEAIEELPDTVSERKEQEVNDHGAEPGV